MYARHFFCAVLGVATLATQTAVADTFGTGENQFEIEFLTIGNPGNAADTTGEPNPAGAVDYVYRIGKYEIPEHAIRRANAATENSANPLNITLDERGPDKPATSVSWFEAAQFVNFLNDDKGAPPAYKFDVDGDFQLWEPGDPGYDPNNPFRNTQARYFLPSVDEWYKAAFYDPAAGVYWDYPTGSDDPPLPVAMGTEPGTAVWNQTTGPADVMLAGGLSPFGTMAQGGNVTEWQESPAMYSSPPEPALNLRSRRGDDWGLATNGTGMSSSAGGNRLADFPANSLGLRVASIPEPATAYLLIVATSGFWLWRLTRNRQYGIANTSLA